jgi:outer membrane protein assembly factor BamB
MSARALLLALCTLVSGAVLAADKPGPNDWPQWQGQNRDGKSPETGLLKSWPKEGPALVWTAKDLGAGFGTPSVAAGKIFGTGSRDGKDGVFALNEADGKELWFTPIDTTRKSDQNNGPSSTPAYADGKVYAVSNNNGVVAKLDATTGKIEWQKSYVKDFGATTPIWGFNDSVLIDGNLAICATSGIKGALTAFKTENGEAVWSTQLGKIDNQRGGGGYSSPIKATVAGIPMYIIILDQAHGIVGVNVKTGEILWSYNKKCFGGTAQIPTPIVSGDKVWFSTAYNDKAAGAALLQLIPDGTGKFTVKELKTYTKAELTNHHGGMVLVDGYVYMGHGQNNGYPACIDMQTGKLMWKADTYPPRAGASAAYSFADGHLYVRYQNRLMTLVKPSPKEEENKVVSSFQLPEPNSRSHGSSWPHPVIANGKLYIRDQNVLYCYNIKGKADA